MKKTPPPPPPFSFHIPTPICILDNPSMNMNNVTKNSEWSDCGLHFYSTALKNDLRSMWDEIEMSFENIERDLQQTYNQYLPKAICELQAVTDNSIIIKFSNNDLLCWLGCTIQINGNTINDTDIVKLDNQVLIENVRSYIDIDLEIIPSYNGIISKWCCPKYDTESVFTDITGGVTQNTIYDLNEDMT
eukprot:364733_1